MPNITIITGATASGKTSYSLNYAKQFEKAIIINADASAVYRDFPILTAQPEEKEGIEHFLFEICDIRQNFTVSKWLDMCESILLANQFENHHKIIVGGTCMYIFLLINGLIQSPEISFEAREEALKLYNTIGHDEFLNLVSKHDENTSKDRQRLINNYSLIIQTGKSFTEWQKEPKKMFLQKGEYELIKINPSREQIYANCNARFLEMLKKGAIDEVQKGMEFFGKDYDFKKVLCANEIKDYHASSYFEFYNRTF